MTHTSLTVYGDIRDAETRCYDILKLVAIVAGGLGGFLLSATTLLLTKRQKFRRKSLVITTVLGAATGYGFMMLYIRARWGDVYPVALLPLAYTLWQLVAGLSLKLTTTKNKWRELQEF